jgi:hypothetical protein
MLRKSSIINYKTYQIRCIIVYNNDDDFIDDISTGNDVYG